jgi:hypothetical protein
MMSGRFHELTAEGISLTIDLSHGHLRHLKVTWDGKTSAPLHLAPWADDPDAAHEPDTAPNVMALGGDFLCAPFGGNDVEPAPTHGWPANSPWSLVAETRLPEGGVTASFRLERKVFGAGLTKEVTLRDGHPFVYQRHLFQGGEGRITAAHHVNTRLPAGGRLSFSAKAYVDIPDTPLETDPARGRFLLAYPARTSDLSALPLANGGSVDLHRYPIGERHEDFVMLAEAPASPLGWTAAIREGARDLLLVLKDPAVLPVTLLWLSNGGRDYAPWSGRHTGVLGIEDARCWSLYGHAASIADNPLSRSGVPTFFTLRHDGAVELRHVFGSVPLAPGWSDVAEVWAGEGQVVLRDNGGATLRLPCDHGFLAGPALPGGA